MTQGRAASPSFEPERPPPRSHLRATASRRARCRATNREPASQRSMSSIASTRGRPAPSSRSVEAIVSANASRASWASSADSGAGGSGSAGRPTPGRESESRANVVRARSVRARAAVSSVGARARRSSEKMPRGAVPTLVPVARTTSTPSPARRTRTSSRKRVRPRPGAPCTRTIPGASGAGGTRSALRAASRTSSSRDVRPTSGLCQAREGLGVCSRGFPASVARAAAAVPARSWGSFATSARRSSPGRRGARSAPSPWMSVRRSVRAPASASGAVEARGPRRAGSSEMRARSTSTGFPSSTRTPWGPIPPRTRPRSWSRPSASRTVSATRTISSRVRPRAHSPSSSPRAAARR